MATSLGCFAPLLVAVLFAPACGDNEGGGGGDERRLVILHTNDEHSHLFGFAPEIDDFPAPTEPGDGDIVGGIVRRAQLLGDERAAAAAEGIDTVTVSAGDETQGALPQIAYATTSPDFAFMHALGYDVMCPGNHEFDQGPDAYAAAISAAAARGGVPGIVSSNIHFDPEDEADDALEALYGDPGSDAPIQPYRIIETESGIRVGFFGVMGSSASFYAPLKSPVRFSAEDPEDEGVQDTVMPLIYADIEPVVEELRDQVDVVVMVSHSGVDTGQPELGDDYLIAQNVPGIDIIVSGHSHTPLEEPQMAEGPDGHTVPIVQAGSYGRFLGRAELVLREGERPAIDTDPERTGLRVIDDSIVPSDQAMLAELDDIIAEIEADVLPAQISLIEGEEVTDDPGELGDLYFRAMGETEFDVIGSRAKVETNILNMSTDAMLAVAEELAGPTTVAVQASGQVRDDILVGETGVLTYADLYRILPLGENPEDGSPGYPLTRFYIYTVELKAAFEVGAARGYIEDSLYLGAAGVKVEYDTSREPQNVSSQAAALNPQNGRVTKILVDVNHEDGVEDYTVALFDIDRKGAEWESELGDAFELQPVVTSLYIASFAATAGVTLKDMNGDEISLTEAILRRPDESPVKDYESFISYVRAICADNGGLLPARYDETSEEGAIPRRMICSGPLCVE
jgi:5'-nucleotidase / UDP-sugar diphosphatase